MHGSILELKRKFNGVAESERVESSAIFSQSIAIKLTRYCISPSDTNNSQILRDANSEFCNCNSQDGSRGRQLGAAMLQQERSGCGKFPPYRV